ncbi:protein JTB [Scyliorhinus canicula]|uniref:protein JTB n=1 Tax=Scyliorhinus canicula TaxID=7830 RepID=UPI0018F58EAC|nr:protein JTB [Scyliorhinus canicula]
MGTTVESWCGACDTEEDGGGSGSELASPVIELPPLDFFPEEGELGRPGQGAGILQSWPCWEKEEFSIIRKCTSCSDYEKKVKVECAFTGFVEEIQCTSDHKYRSCRSDEMEELKFWRFEGIVVLVGVIFAIIVLFRQRALDRRAEQKVRRQLESI